MWFVRHEPWRGHEPWRRHEPWRTVRNTKLGGDRAE